jgi:hypothetical protein
MKSINDMLQWLGVVFIVLGHVFNAMGNMDPYNILMFFFGTIVFLAWAYRVRNSPQVVVNIVSMIICTSGLYRASI